MTHYYQKEEEPRETPETALAERRQQASALDGVLTQTAQDLNTMEQLLGGLYSEAEKRGDTAAMTQANDVWQLANQFAVRMTQFDADRMAGIVFGDVMAELHQQLAQEKVDLEYDNRDLKRQLQDVKDERRAALSQAYQDIFHEMHMGISAATGCKDWAAVYRVSELLTGQKPFTMYQAQLLKDLVQSVLGTEAAAS